MGKQVVAGAILVALLLVAGPLAGCIGSSSDGTQDTGDSDTSTGDQDPQTGDDGTDDGSDDGSDGSDDTGDDSDGNETDSGDDGPTWETTNSSTSAEVIASTQDTLPTPGFVVPQDAGRMTVLDSKPAAFTGILVEVTWTSQTDGTQIDHIQVEIRDGATEEGETNAPTSAWMNDTRSAAHEPVSIWVLPDDYEEGSLEIWAHPIRDQMGLWVQPEITASTTVFQGGEPIWSFSAVEA